MAKRCTRETESSGLKKCSDIIHDDWIDSICGCHIEVGRASNHSHIKVYAYNGNRVGWWLSDEEAEKIAVAMLDEIGYDIYLRKKTSHGAALGSGEFEALPDGETLDEVAFNKDDKVGFAIYKEMCDGDAVIRTFGLNSMGSGWGFVFAEWFRRIETILNNLGYQIFYKTEKAKRK